MPRKPKSIHKPRKHAQSGARKAGGVEGSKKSGNVPTLKLEPKQAPVEARVLALSKETEPEICIPKMDLPHVFPAYVPPPPLPPTPDAQVWVPKMNLPREFPAMREDLKFE